jgi:two-component system NtrC family response regulator
VVTADKVLVIEDDPLQQMHLRAALGSLDLLEAYDRAEALALVREHTPSVVLLDLGLPPDPHSVSEGFAVLEAILDAAPGTKVIVMTGQQEHDHAVRAVGCGAYDFHLKPIQTERIRLALDRALHLARLEDEHQRRLRGIGGTSLPGVIGDSGAMRKVCRTIERIAPAEVSVVLTGESGTGKEVMARALHATSPRAAHRFVAINCAAIPETLLEAELFGYERGAFTGAVKQTPGKIEYADRGVLFLDEIGDLPLALQAKLLRFLQERVLERIGGRREIEVDVRVICATHRDLRKLMHEGAFREDLYYRLAEINVHIPPLREREGDALLLARYVLTQYGCSLGRRIKGFTSGALRALDAYHWPGNVRELQNRVKRAVIMAEGARIRTEDLDLPTEIEEAGDLDLRSCREQVERMVLRRALARAEGNLSQAARLIGVSRPTLSDLLRQHRLRGCAESGTG